MRVLGAMGFSNSGKTTALATIARELHARGHRVLVTKDIHKEGVWFDKKGKDTWTYREAGADYVLGRSEEDAAIFLPPRITGPEILTLAGTLGVDFLLVEGFTAEIACPRVVCLTKPGEMNQLAEVGRHTDEIICFAGRLAEHREEFHGRPVVSALRQPARLVQLALDHVGVPVDVPADVPAGGPEVE